MVDVCELSLILPAFNEEAGIANAIAEGDEALARLGVNYEILVVDDGSTDRTSQVVTEYLARRASEGVGDAAARPSRARRAKSSIRLLRHDRNLGYGAALRTGFTAARGRLVAFTDADCQFYLDDLGSLLPLLDNHHVAVGYRMDRQDSRLRKFYSRGYNLLSRALLGTQVRDIDCAFKVFRRDALQRVLPETNGFFANTEMLTKARQQHLRIAEVGVRHRPRKHGCSKVSITDIPRVLNVLLPFWWMRVVFPGDQRAAHDVSGLEASSAAFVRGSLMFVLALITCTLFLTRLDHPLLEPEEARYAEIPRQMLAEGRFVTPVLHGEDYWQKPPVLYWLVMLSYRLFGVADWSVRLVPALAGIGSVAITTLWAWRTLGFWTGFMSGAVLALSARFLYLAGMLSMDGPLCAFVLAGLACGHLAFRDEERRGRWLMLSALACALGVLMKGPVAVILTTAPLIALAFLDRRVRFWTVRECAGYFGIVAFVAGPWFAVMAWSEPDAAGSFVWLHHVLRYFAPIDHDKPAWFYVPSLLLGMLPWTLLLIPAVPFLTRRSTRAAARRPAALGMFVLAFVWCVAFFSLSGCKRQGYILPAFPLLAVVLGTFVTHGLPWHVWIASVSRVADRAGHRWARALTLTGCAMGVACSLAASVATMWPWTPALVLSCAFVVLGALVLRPPMRMPVWTSWAGSAAIMFFFLLMAQRALLPDYHDRFGLRRQVEISAAYEQEEELPVFTYPKRWDSVSFYSQRSNVESFAKGDLEALIGELKKHERTLVFVRRDGALKEVRDALPTGMTLDLLGRQTDYVAVALVRKR